MKVRQSFVSNSSSTSFTFCFSGGSLYDMIEKYSVYFDLATDFESYDGEKAYTCNATDVINAIKHSGVGFKSVDEYIKELEKEVKEWQERSKEKDSSNYIIEYIMDTTSRIEKLKTSKKRGLDVVLVIGFGDNHGDISGGNIGNAMDYEGRHININKSDFVVYTEQNR